MILLTVPFRLGHLIYQLIETANCTIQTGSLIVPVDIRYLFLDGSYPNVKPDMFIVRKEMNQINKLIHTKHYIH